MSSSDIECIRRGLNGEPAAFEALYAAHAGRVKAYFLRSGLSGASADDATQDTFARAFRSLVTFNAERGSFATWLGAIARNVARRLWQQRREGNFDPDLADEMFASGLDPAADAAAREEIDAVRECVADLPEDLSRIVHLRYVEGRTTRGIAAAVNVPEATVRSRLDQARASIRRCLQSRGVLK